MKVYCCFSLYNLYIAVAKAMVQNEKIDLVIGSQMPDYKILNIKIYLIR